MGMIRYDCSVVGFERNWAEISDRWTRRQILALEDTDESAIAMLQEKIGDCHLETDAGTIEHGSQLTRDSILDMTAEVHGFLLQLPYRVWAQRSTVGKVNARLSSPPNGTIPQPTPTATTT